MPPTKFTVPLSLQITLISVIPLLYQILRNSPAVLTPTLESQFAISATQMGLVASAVSFGAMLAILPAARWVIRFGVKPVLLWASLVITLGATGFALAQSTTQLFVARFIIGLGSGPYLTAALARAEEGVSVQQFRDYSGEISLVGRLGSLVATAPLALLMQLLAWRGAIGLLAILSGIFSVVLALTVSDSQRQPTPAKHRVSWQKLFIPLVISRLWVLIVLLGTISTIMGLWGGPWLIARYQLSPNHTGWVLSLMAAGFAVGSMICVTLARYLHRYTVPTLLLTSLILLVPMALNQLPMVCVYPLFFVLGITLSPTALVIAEIRQAVPEGVIVRALAVSSLAFSLGIFLYQALSGFVIDLFPSPAPGHHALAAYQALFSLLIAGLFTALLVQWRFQLPTKT